MPSSCVVPAKIAAYQDRFSRQRQTNRFQKHKREHDPSAVLMDQLLHDGTTRLIVVSSRVKPQVAHLQRKSYPYMNV
jgi:hypothetical protein